MDMDPMCLGQDQSWKKTSQQRMMTDVGLSDLSGDDRWQYLIAGELELDVNSQGKCHIFRRTCGCS